MIRPFFKPRLRNVEFSTTYTQPIFERVLASYSLIFNSFYAGLKSNPPLSHFFQFLASPLTDFDLNLWLVCILKSVRSDNSNRIHSRSGGFSGLLSTNLDMRIFSDGLMMVYTLTLQIWGKSTLNRTPEKFVVFDRPKPPWGELV